MLRTCAECGTQLNRYNPGKLCFPCQDKRREKIAARTKQYYDVDDMMEMMGLESTEQVKRKGRAGLIPGRIPERKAHLYNREVVDQWIKSGGLPLHRPSSPLQQEAYERCIKKDHSWLSDEKFDGIAYGTETISERGESSINVKSRRTCYFCDHSEILDI
jgi:hypothetical protein